MIDTNKIYTSSNGEKFKVINYNNSKDIDVEFLVTGYKTKAQATEVRSGSIKDKLLPSVYGVGFIGDGKYKARSSGKITKQYQKWRRMLDRCYNDKSRSKNKTYVDCSVCTEWHNFQSFAKWFDENYIDGFELDKDILVEGNKVYSPETCLFVSSKDNKVKAHAKRYKFLSPDGDIVEVYNLAEFSRQNNLNESLMSQVNSGKRNQHKGWKHHG